MLVQDCASSFSDYSDISKQENPANVKENAWQRCMFECPLRTKSRLTDSNTMIMNYEDQYSVLFTLAGGRNWSCAVDSSKIMTFLGRVLIFDALRRRPL